MEETLQQTTELDIARPESTPAKLQIIEHLLNGLHEQNLLYCHWKSNEHLGASMQGDTDLDVLFNIDQKEKIEALLQQLSFKKFCSIKLKQYKDIEDYIGLDYTTGKVVHVHAHFRLTMGEMYLKGYQLDIEEQVLNSRVFNDEFGIYCSSPAMELILLYFREALKIRRRDIAWMFLRRKVELSGNTLVEYKWLKHRVTNNDIKITLQSILNQYEQVYEIMCGKFNRRELLKLARILKKEFSNNRLYSPGQALLMRWYREAAVRVLRKLSKQLSVPITAQRINPRGGLVVAIVGADGSGKSTVTADLKNTFSVKLDVHSIYFGRGDGHKSLARHTLNSIKDWLQPSKSGKKQTIHIDSFRGSRKSIFKNAYRHVNALLVASEKKRNLKAMQEAKAKGMLVICDRYPQNQTMGYNDGPILYDSHSSGNAIFKTISKMEQDVYRQAQQAPPDLLFKLIADAEVVEARKPGETSLEILQKKIDGIKALTLPQPCKTITIDAAQPLSQVLATIKKEIWEAIN